VNDTGAGIIGAIIAGLDDMDEACETKRETQINIETRHRTNWL